MPQHLLPALHTQVPPLAAQPIALLAEYDTPPGLSLPNCWILSLHRNRIAHLTASDPLKIKTLNPFNNPLTKA
jgi:hypothetical protein